jgi:hypothetical protein
LEIRQSLKLEDIFFMSDISIKTPPDLTGFSPIQREIYLDIRKYRWSLCTVRVNKHLMPGYLLSYGQRWSTKMQQENPLLYTHVKIGFVNGKSTWRDPEETNILLTDIVSVDQQASSLEETCKKHPCLSVLQLARSFYLSKKIKELEENQRMLSCEHKSNRHGFEFPIGRAVIYAIKGRMALGYNLETALKVASPGDLVALTSGPSGTLVWGQDSRNANSLESNFGVENILWDSLEEIDRIESLTSNNQELRKFAKDKRIIWLEQVQDKVQSLISQINQDTNHINSLLNNFQFKGKTGRRILIPNDQFPILTEMIQKKAEEEIVKLELLQKKEEFFSALKKYKESMTSYVENYEEFGIKN